MVYQIKLDEDIDKSATEISNCLEEDNASTKNYNISQGNKKLCTMPKAEDKGQF